MALAADGQNDPDIPVMIDVEAGGEAYQEMHVDGFRFDLASALARELHDVDRLSAFFDIIHQDPILSQVKAQGRLQK